MTAAIRPMTAAATPSRKGRILSLFGDRDEPAVKEDRKHESGQEDPDGHQQGPAQAPGEIADEGREDDQRSRQRAADREPVDELAVGEPVVPVDGGVLEEGDHGVGAAEGHQSGLEPLEEDLAV